MSLDARQRYSLKGFLSKQTRPQPAFLSEMKISQPAVVEGAEETKLLSPEV